MTTNIATTREQSTRLLQCGVSAESADTHWHGAIVPRGGSLTSPPEPSEEWDLFNSPYGFMPEEMQKAKLMEDYNEIIPAWSLSALLGLLPKEIEDYHLSIESFKETHYTTYIRDNYDDYLIPHKDAPELIDALYSLLVWVIDHKHVKLG